MARRHIRVVGAMLEGEPGRYLITQRPPKATLPGLWEFPGGRVMEGESDPEALTREINERLGVEAQVLELAAQTHHQYEDYDLDFFVFYCRLKDPQAKLANIKAADHRWVTLQEMSNYQFPGADARTLAKLLELDH
jgi:8-oxo-dGTP diphosphatase